MTEPTAAEVEAIIVAALRAAKELAVECDRLELLTQFRDAENCVPLVEARLREQIAGAIEALRARHFAQHGNEETGPRNYDWGLTHAGNLARTGYPLGHALDAD